MGVEVADIVDDVHLHGLEEGCRRSGDRMRWPKRAGVDKFVERRRGRKGV
jgi:hypothetical protein